MRDRHDQGFTNVPSFEVWSIGLVCIIGCQNNQSANGIYLHSATLLESLLSTVQCHYVSRKHYMHCNIGTVWWWVWCDDGWVVIWTIDVFFMSANPGEYFAYPLSHPHTQSLLGWRTHQRRSIVSLLTNCTWRRREGKSTEVQVLIPPFPTLHQLHPSTLHTEVSVEGESGKRAAERCVCVCACVCVVC